MARRDVDIVVRARDEAAKAIETITKAFADFNAGQATMEARAGKTENALGKLGTALASIKQVAGDSTGIDLLNQSYDRARATYDKVRTSVNNTREAFRQQQQALAQADAAMSRHTQKLTGAQAAYARQNEAINRTKAAQRGLEQELRRTEAAQTRAIAAQARMPAQIERQTAAVARAEANYARLRNEVAQTVQPTERLQASLTSAEGVLTRQNARLDDLRTRYATLGSTITGASETMIRLRTSVDATTAELAEKEQVLSRIGRGLENWKQQVAASAQAQRQLAQETARTGNALAAQEGDLTSVRQGLAGFTRESNEANTAVQNLAQRGMGVLRREYLETFRAMREGQEVYAQLSDAATRLASEIGRVGVPTREMVEQFQRTVVSAQEAKTEMQTLQTTVHQLRGAYDQMDGTLEGVEQAQRQFAQIQQQTQRAMQQTATAAERQRAAISASLGATDRAAGANRRVAASAREVATATNSAATSTNRLRQAYDQLYGGSRQSLSLLQRIRGEVLALTASYVGLFAAFQGIGAVNNALQSLVGVQSRLAVVFEGNEAATTRELDFMRRTADRLGISFSLLADQYTRFAVASRGTRLEGQATRDIFVAVAEAARANNSNVQQMERVFLALEQMVSKGTISMEELRQQLGDSLPGAFGAMAEAAANAGLITDRFATDELTKLIENGELSSDILIEFAEVLEDRFGPGLEGALNSVTTAWGRLTNAVFQFLLAIGQGAFEESLIRLLNNLSEFLRSGQAVSVAERIGSALASMADAASWAADNFNLLVAAAGLFLGLKLTPFIVAAVAQLVLLKANALSMGLAFANWRAGLVGVTTATTAATTATGVFRGVLAALFTPGGAAVAIPLIVAGLALWSTRTNEATDALVEHRNVLDTVRNAYEAVEGSVEEWRNQVQGLTTTQLRANLEGLENGIEEVMGRIRAEINSVILDSSNVLQNLFGAGPIPGAEAMVDLFQQYRDGQIDVRALRDELDILNEQFREGDDELIALGRSLGLHVDRLVQLEDATREAELAIQAKTGTDEEAADALEELAGATEDAAEATRDATQMNEEYQEALEELRGLVPDIAEELRILDEVGQLTAARDGALALAQNFGQALEALNLFQRGIDNLNNSTVNFENAFTATRFGLTQTPQATGVDGAPVTLPNYSGTQLEELVRASTMMAEQLGVSARDVLAVMSFETGGTLDPWQAGPTTQWGQHRGLIQWGEPQAQQYGVSEASSITEQVMAAGRYLADRGVEAGDNLAAVYAAVLAGDASLVDRGDINNGGVVTSVLDAVSGEQFAGHIARAEGLLAAYGGVVQATEESIQLEERRAEQAADFQQSLTERTESLEFENSLNGMARADAEAARVLREAELEAQRAGVELTAEQRTQLEALTRERVAQEEAQRRTTSSRREESAELRAARAAEEQVTLLTQQRAALMEEMTIAEEAGNQGRVTELRTEIDTLNTSLMAAIDNAMRMWEAVGGQAATTAIAQLRTARAEAENFNNEARTSQVEWSKVGNLLVNGLTKAFDTFARAVAEGKSVGEAAREAFLQFAADFLIEIGKMIVQQMVLNLLRGVFGGTSFGATIGLGHTGGMVGSSRVGSGNSSRRVDPGMFASAMRYHTGGIVGLRPGEVPIIAKQGEEMLTEDDPRHAMNQMATAATSSSGKSLKIINAFSGSEMMSEALGSAEGEEVLMNFLRRNGPRVRAVIG